MITSKSLLSSNALLLSLSLGSFGGGTKQEAATVPGLNEATAPISRNFQTTQASTQPTAPKLNIPEILSGFAKNATEFTNKFGLPAGIAHVNLPGTEPKETVTIKFNMLPEMKVPDNPEATVIEVIRYRPGMVNGEAREIPDKSCFFRSDTWAPFAIKNFKDNNTYVNLQSPSTMKQEYGQAVFLASSALRFYLGVDQNYRADLRRFSGPLAPTIAHKFSCGAEKKPCSLTKVADNITFVYQGSWKSEEEVPTRVIWRDKKESSPYLVAKYLNASVFSGALGPKEKQKQFVPIHDSLDIANAVYSAHRLLTSIAGAAFASSQAPSKKPSSVSNTTSQPTTEKVEGSMDKDLEFLTIQARAYAKNAGSPRGLFPLPNKQLLRIVAPSKERMTSPADGAAPSKIPTVIYQLYSLSGGQSTWTENLRPTLQVQLDLSGKKSFKIVAFQLGRGKFIDVAESGALGEGEEPVRKFLSASGKALNEWAGWTAAWHKRCREIASSETVVMEHKSPSRVLRIERGSVDGNVVTVRRASQTDMIAYQGGKFVLLDSSGEPVWKEDHEVRRVLKMSLNEMLQANPAEFKSAAPVTRSF